MIASLKARVIGALLPLAMGFTLFFASTPEAQAHPLSPGLLQLEELAGGRYAVLWKVPSATYDAVRLEPRLPARCHELDPAARTDNGIASISTWVVDCGAPGLAGESIRIRGLEQSSTDVLVTVIGLHGPPLHVVLSSVATTYTVPATPHLRQVFSSYGQLGVEHILTGYDHVLFVVALTLLVVTLRRLLIAVTGFTLGHSLTLSLATLDVIHVPAPPIEAMIAGSIVVLAAEVAARGRRDTLIVRAPWLVTTIFGLFHGLGFAGALREIGLPHAATVPALAAFNIGVEVGQLGIVCACLLVGVLLRRLTALAPLLDVRLAAYPIGLIAAFWTIERVVTALAIQ
jgi:hydrogenase/urease accessory protein HupE